MGSYHQVTRENYSVNPVICLRRLLHAHRFPEPLGQPEELWFLRKTVLFIATSHCSFPSYYRCMLTGEGDRGGSKIKTQSPLTLVCLCFLVCSYPRLQGRSTHTTAVLVYLQIQTKQCICFFPFILMQGAC